MSHFSLMVITDEKPTKEELVSIMAPFHEFECTGIDDQYVQDVDVTEEARREFEEAETSFIQAPDGSLHCPYSDEFYREPTEEESQKIGPWAGSGYADGLSWRSQDWGDDKGYRTKVRFIPDGWKRVNKKTSEVKSFSEWAFEYYGNPIVKPNSIQKNSEDTKYGWIKVDDSGNVVGIIKRTNPNSKWDWWKLGGRWSGFLTPTHSAAEMPEGKDNPEKGSPGLMGCESNAAGVDMARKGDVDFEAMRRAAKEKAEVEWDRVREIVGDLKDYVPWKKVLDSCNDIKKAREVYRAQPAYILAREAGKKDINFSFINLGDYAKPREQHSHDAGLSAVTTFAALKGGEWVEKGQMGWWGCVSNEKEDWPQEFNRMLDAIPDDNWLTIIDCHI